MKEGIGNFNQIKGGHFFFDLTIMLSFWQKCYKYPDGKGNIWVPWLLSFTLTFTPRHEKPDYKDKKMFCFLTAGRTESWLKVSNTQSPCPHGPYKLVVRKVKDFGC